MAVPNYQAPTDDFWATNAPPPDLPISPLPDIPDPSAAAPPSAAAGAKTWIDQALSEAQSTDDPAYWYGVIAKDPKVAAGDASAIAYWKGRIAQGDGALAVRNGTRQKFNDSGAAPNPNAALPVTPYGGIGSTPSPYVNPEWTGGPAPTAPPLIPFTRPTQADLEASPGYQSRLAAGLQARNRSAAAQGSVLSGGTQQVLAQYGQDYASNEYNNLFGQGLALNQNNNNVTQGNFGNAFETYQANYGQFQDAATRGFNAYGLNVTTQRNAGNDYWSHLKDLFDAGATAANNSYKPSNVP